MIEIDFLADGVRTRYSQTDIGTSNLFVDSFADEMVFCADQKSWYVWNGKHWEIDVSDKVNEKIKKLYLYCIKFIFDKKLNDETQKFLLDYYGKLSSKTMRDRIIKDAMSVKPTTTAQFDRHKFLFNCTNGTFDFKTGEFRKHDRADMLTDISTVTYNPKADCPMFKKYVAEVMQNRAVNIDYLLKMSAYLLTGDTSRECFFILYGDSTRNGKGTFVSTLTHLAGTYSKTLNAASITRRQLNGGGSNASPDIAKLKNARMASVNELEDGMMLDIALMKRWTGGDTETARFLYKAEFEFVPQFKVFINTNRLPRMTDDSIFRSDRLHLLLFDRHFEPSERDLNLKDKLKTETSGIFNYIYEHYKKLQNEGFIIPDSSKQEIEKYQLNSNNILSFVKESLFADNHSYEKTSDLYNAYRAWCEESGLNSKSKKNFKEEMIKNGAVYLPDKCRQKNNKGESDVTFWVRGFSLTKPTSIQQGLPNLIAVKNPDELPF